MTGKLEQWSEEGRRRIAALRTQLSRLSRRKRVLIVDDETSVADSMAQLVSACDCEPFIAYTGESGLHALRTMEIDLMLLDLKMPGMSGIEVLRESRSWPNPVQCIIITGYGDSPMVEEAYSMGAVTVMLKPVTLDQMREILITGRV